MILDQIKKKDDPANPKMIYLYLFQQNAKYLLIKLTNNIQLKRFCISIQITISKQEFMSGTFQQKLVAMKHKLQTNPTNTIKHCHQNNHSTKNIIVNQETQNVKKQALTSQEELRIQEPIIIQRKVSRPASGKKENNAIRVNTSYSKLPKKEKKKVEVFTPIQIPTRDGPVLDPQTLPQTAVVTQSYDNKEIQIKIQRDDQKQKECLKKLFKKIHKLTDDLNAAQKENTKLKFQLETLSHIEKKNLDHERIINRLEGDKYKLEMEVQHLNKLLKDRDEELKRANSRVPKEIIKQIVVEKPVQVIVEVPKEVPGPQRVVEKIVEVPKYIEVEKKVPVEIPGPSREVVKTVQVPKIIQKPVQVRVQVPVQVPVEVPVEVPVYVDKPVFDQECYMRIKRLEGEMQMLIKQNEALFRENSDLRMRLEQLKANLEVLSRHNLQKNRETEILMQNHLDYFPISPAQDISSGSAGYSISSHPHTKII